MDYRTFFFLMCIICGLFPHEFMRLVALCACAAHTEADVYRYIYRCILVHLTGLEAWV